MKITSDFIAGFLMAVSIISWGILIYLRFPFEDGNKLGFFLIPAIFGFLISIVIVKINE